MTAGLVWSISLATGHWSPIPTASAANGITITPPMASIELPAEQSRYRFTAMLQNSTDKPVNLVIRTEDFGNLEETGGVFFLGTEPNERWDPHRLADWITLSPQRLHLNPGEQKEVVAEIVNDHNLSPGGHYAALVASIETNRNNAQIAINQAISSLLFVNKIGGEEYRISVQTVESDAAWWGRVQGVHVSLQNSGNTHIIPRGSVKLRGPLGRDISHGVINSSSTLLMPDSTQEFSTNLTQLGLPLWPGKYTLVLSYRYDGQDEVYTIEQEYMSIGIVATGGIVILIAFVIGFFIKRQFKPSDL